MYGLNDDIKKYIDEKIEKNKTFLKNLTFYNDDYKLCNMFDSDMNANISPARYFAEVNNRVHTIFKYSKELNLYPVFVTITAPSAFHNSSSEYNGSTAKDTSLYLSKLWSGFLQLKVFKHIKEFSGIRMIYIRVVEPHKSGVPHIHAMLFLPKSFINKVEFKFFEHFTKQDINKKALKFITNFKHAKYEDSLGAIAYILKYMNKTFKNSKTDTMTNEAYYYSYYKIRRFTTSQTLVPLWLYRKVRNNLQNRDLLQLTKDYRAGHVYACFDKTFVFQRYLEKEKIVYDEELGDYEIYTTVEEKIIYQKNNFISSQFKNYNKVFDSVPTKFIRPKKPVPIFKDGFLKFFFYNGVFVEYRKHITNMSDWELQDYYINYEIEDSSYVLYLAVQNLLITKGLLFGVELVSLDSFDFDSFFGFDKFKNKKYTWYCEKDLGIVL